MKTATKWGNPEVDHHFFDRTPFGEVELLNFYKNSPYEYTILLELRRGITIMDPPRFTWWNCNVQDAYAIFGIEQTEGTMWGEDGKS